MKKISMGILIVFFLGVFIAGSLGLARAAEPKTFRGKTSQKDAFYVELSNPENKKVRFSLTFTEMSGTLDEYFGKVGKLTKDPEVILSLMDNGESTVAKVHCRLDQFRFGSGGGLSYKGEISGDQAARTSSVSVKYQYP